LQKEDEKKFLAKTGHGQHHEPDEEQDHCGTEIRLNER
jgi:hypothetical protein